MFGAYFVSVSTCCHNNLQATVSLKTVHIYIGKNNYIYCVYLFQGLKMGDLWVPLDEEIPEIMKNVGSAIIG